MTRKTAPVASRTMLVWAIPITVLALIGGFLAGERSGARAASPPAVNAMAGGAASIDLSKLSPQERANHLYDRVMRLSETGHLDSVRFYAPMALQAYAALGTADAHTHYDVGMIWAAVGDSLKARSEAETILIERPTHLLGLLLAMRSAATPSLRDSYRRRFVQSSKAELATPLPEYDEHRHDIEGALQASGVAKK